MFYKLKTSKGDMRFKVKILLDRKILFFLEQLQSDNVFRLVTDIKSFTSDNVAKLNPFQHTSNTHQTCST